MFDGYKERHTRRVTWYGVVISAVLVIVKLVLVMLRRDASDATSYAAPAPAPVQVAAPAPPPPRSELFGFSVAPREPMSPTGTYALGHAVGRDPHEIVNWQPGTLGRHVAMLDRLVEGLDVKSKHEDPIMLGRSSAVRVTLELATQHVVVVYVECDDRLVELESDLGDAGEAFFQSFACTPAPHAPPTRLVFDAPPRGWSAAGDGEIYQDAHGTIVRAGTLLAPDLAVRTAVGQYLDGTHIDLLEGHSEGDRTVFAIDISGDDPANPKVRGELQAWRCTDREVAIVWFYGPALATARKFVASGRCER